MQEWRGQSHRMEPNYVTHNAAMSSRCRALKESTIYHALKPAENASMMSNQCVFCDMRVPIARIRIKTVILNAEMFL